MEEAGRVGQIWKAAGTNTRNTICDSIPGVAGARLRAHAPAQVTSIACNPPLLWYITPVKSILVYPGKTCREFRVRFTGRKEGVDKRITIRYDSGVGQQRPTSSCPVPRGCSPRGRPAWPGACPSRPSLCHTIVIRRQGRGYAPGGAGGDIENPVIATR